MTPTIRYIAYDTEVVRTSAAYLYAHLLMNSLRDDITGKLGRNMVQPYNTQQSTHLGHKVVELINSLAKDYKESSWRNIIGRMNNYQPDPKFHCTMAIINPFTSRLEWITVKCEEKHNISTILCEKQVSQQACINKQF